MIKSKLSNLAKSSLQYIMIFIISSFPLLSFFYSCNNENDYPEDVSTGTPVEITHPIVTNISDYIELNGTTFFLNNEIVRATFQGYIDILYKNIGDNVNPGENILQIKTLESAATESLMVSLGAPQFRGNVNIKAKFGGILTTLLYHEGDYVSNGENIAIISNPSSMRIKLNVPFENVQKIKIGSKCEILLPGGDKITGVVEKNIPSIDSITQTQTYFIKLSNSRSLPENLNVTVRIPFQQTKDALVLPKSSVVTNVTQDSFWVMKLINNETAVRINVQKGVENDSLVQLVNTTLTPDDRVILNGAYGLPDTVKVEITK